MNHKLEELVDIGQLQNLLELLYDASGIPSGIVDPEGRVLAGAGWQPACTLFHRHNPKSNQRCVESDTELTRQSARIQNPQKAKGPLEYAAYKCKNGLWDIAIPIHIQGQHVANYFLGQFLYEDEEIDLDFFERQGRQFHYDREEYLKAIKELPRFSRQKVESILAFNTQLVNYLAELGSQKLAQLELIQKLNETKQALVNANALVEGKMKKARPVPEESPENGSEGVDIRKGEITRIVHDLKNPLNGIFGFAQLISAEADKTGKPEIGQYVGSVIDSARAMITQVNELMALAESEAITRVKTEPIKMKFLWDYIGEIFAARAKSRGIELALESDPEMEIVGSPDFLKSIMANLVSNALKYSPEKTAVRIESRRKGTVDILVRDEGLGIPPEDRDQLFGKFSRLSNQPLTEEGSTGIGLYISRNLARKQGGDIHYQPNEPRGSIFTLSLPNLENQPN